MTNNYYTKARTEKGLLIFRTKEDFDEWRSKTKEGALLREIKPTESKEEKLIGEVVERFDKEFTHSMFCKDRNDNYSEENKCYCEHSSVKSFLIAELKNFYKDMTK